MPAELACAGLGPRGFPLRLQATGVRINPVDFNPDFVARMIPKVEWAALLEAADTLRLVKVPKGWRWMCWRAPCNAQSRDVCSPSAVGSPTCCWVMRKLRLKSVPGPGFSLWACVSLFTCISCLLFLSCVSPTLGPVTHQTQCSWARYYFFFSLKFQNQKKKKKKNTGGAAAADSSPSFPRDEGLRPRSNPSRRVKPSNCRCPFHHPLAPNILSRSECQCIS